MAETAREKAARLAREMASDQPSDREREREQASAAAKEIAQLEAVASGDYSSIVGANDNYQERQEKIRAAERTAALLNADPEDFKGNYQERQEKIRAQERLKARIEKYGYGAQEVDSTDDLEQTGETQETKDDILDALVDDFDKDKLNQIEVPEMYIEYELNDDGSIVKDEDGKNVVSSYGVKYSDGTISYTGTGKEGVFEAERQRQIASQYNLYMLDNRTRSDFATDEEYNHFKTVKNIRIGQGSYKYITDKDGTTTLYAPTGKVITSGDLNTVRKEFQTRSNTLYLAITKAESTPTITPFSVRFMMETQGYESEDAVYRKLYNDFNLRKDELKNIVKSWSTDEYPDGLIRSGYLFNILNPITDMRMRTDEQKFQEFKNNYTGQDNFGSYEDYYKNITGTDFVDTTLEEKQPDTTGDTTSKTGTMTGGTGIGGGMTGETGTTTGGTDLTGGMTGGTDMTGGMTGIGGGMTGIGGGMTGEAGTSVGTGNTFTPTNYNPYAGTFTYTGSPADQMAGGVFTMGQQPPQVTGGMTGVTGTNQFQTQSEVKKFKNASGLTANITFINGQPQTPIPAGFFPADQATAQPTTAVDMSATQVTMSEGGIADSSVLETKAAPTTLGQQYVPITPPMEEGAGVTDLMEYQLETPGVPEGAAVIPAGITETKGQFVDPRQGQVDGDVTTTTTGATTTLAMLPDQDKKASKVTASEVSEGIKTAVDATEAATLNPEDSKSKITAAEATSSSVSDLEAATGSHIKMENPVTRKVMDGELIDGVADAETAAKFTEAIDHAEATPSKQATVAGQLEGLMQDFEGGETPPWAAGAMRTAMQSLAARGLGASSMAGQAIIQAAMEASLPIAQADAATVAQFEFKNLSNKQERKMLAAQQRAQFMGQEFDQAFQARVFNATKIGEIANLNFTADQQVALENSRAANTMALANLNNEQALVMAEAAALSQLDLANLDNKQQAAVQNAQNFLAIEMANLSNKQQTDLFKTQQTINGLFSDQAAINAAEQFNATSQNQLDQFIAGLSADVSKFNANQSNAQAQFNAGEANAMEKFTTEINNQREQFNATNRLVIDQSNAQWRREIAKTDTAAVNRANEINASNVLGMNQIAMNNLWNYYSDSMSWAWTSAENERERTVNLAIEQLRADSSKDIQNLKNDYASSANFGALIGKVMTSDLSGSFLGDAFDAITDFFD